MQNTIYSCLDNYLKTAEVFTQDCKTLELRYFLKYCTENIGI